MEVNYADEARTFFKIQLGRYLQECPSRSFSGLPEHDAVMSIIKDAWVELRSSVCISSMSPSGRRALYSTTLIFFPTFVADGGQNCITADFVRGTRISHSPVSVSLYPELDS